MPENTIGRMTERLAPLEPLALEITDDSAAHAGHPGAAGGGGHFRLRLVSARFNGQSKVARHRLVYDCLADLMQRDIHALTMNLEAPGEVERARSTGSPDFEHSSGN